MKIGIQKIDVLLQNQKSYDVGLLQTKAYRILKKKTNAILKQFGITSWDWAVLGVLFKEKESLRARDVAAIVGLEAAQLSLIIDGLVSAGLVESNKDPRDSRAKILTLSVQGKEFVPKAELLLRKEIKPLFSGSSLGDITSYLIVLGGIVSNGEKEECN